jgi:hypothetical protein
MSGHNGDVYATAPLLKVACGRHKARKRAEELTRARK